MENMNNQVSLASAKKSGMLPLAAGYIAAVLSLVLYPFIFGVAGILLGIIASKNGSRSGLSLIVASVALMAAGMLFGVELFNGLIGSSGF